ERAVLGERGQVDGVLLQRLVRRLRILAGDPAVTTHRGHRGTESRRGHAVAGQHGAGRRVDLGKREQQVLGRGEVVLHAGGELDRLGQRAGGGRGSRGGLHGRSGCLGERGEGVLGGTRDGTG